MAEVTSYLSCTLCVNAQYTVVPWPDVPQRAAIVFADTSSYPHQHHCQGLNTLDLKHYMHIRSVSICAIMCSEV